MRRLKIILIYVVAVMAVIGITGFFILPPIVKSIMVDKLSQTLKG